MGHPSVTYQVKEALNHIFSPGDSRHDLKARGLDRRRITSINTMRAYVKSCSLFARWCQDQYAVRDINDITPEMAMDYIDELLERELSGGYIGKVSAALRKLDVALRESGAWDHDAPALLEPGGGWHSERRPERAYTPEQAEMIISEMDRIARDRQAPLVARLQRIAGLRITEAVMIRGEDIDPATGILNVDRGTKGGRPRTVTIGSAHRGFLETLCDRAEEHRDGHVFRDRGHLGQGLARRTGGAVRAACARLDIECYGTHGFRRCWAQARHRQLTLAGADDRSARQAVARGLGHRRIDVTKSYIPQK
jgi:integrase